MSGQRCWFPSDASFGSSAMVRREKRNDRVASREPPLGMMHELLERIGTGRTSIKVKTLVSHFGFDAKARVRQSSLAAALAALDRAGVRYRFPSGTRANDYVTLWRDEGVAPAPRAKPAVSAGATELVSGAEYRVLSVRPPWAWSIMFAGKDVENRSWTTPHRGPILIHASSKKYVGAELQDVRREIAECSGRSLSAVPHEFPRSQMLGFVDIVDCVQRRRSSWAAPGEEHWLLANPRPLTRPVMGVDGKLNLWRWTCP